MIARLLHRLWTYLTHDPATRWANLTAGDDE